MAWLFNIRGSDVKYNPVVLSFALINENEANLYIDKTKLTATNQAILAQNGVIIKAYDKVGEDLQNLSSENSDNLK